MALQTFLIAHVSKGKNEESKPQDIAQARVTAKTEAKAKHRFADRFPEREITTIGVVGGG